jgi:plasmid stabilization system protein ParE
MAAYRQTVRAEKDLIDIWLSVAADSPAAADMLLDTLDTKARRLADNPKIDLIFYHVVDDTIEVYRFIHGARDYKTLLTA